MSDFFESTDIKALNTKEVSKGVKLTLLVFTLISALLIIFQKYIYDWLINLNPSPTYKVLVWIIIALHVVGLTILLVGSFFAATGKLLKRPLFLWTYFSTLNLVLLGTVVSFLSGIDCFLTALEKVFRFLAGMSGYQGGFIAYYLSSFGLNVSNIVVTIICAVILALAIAKLHFDNRRKITRYKNFVQVNILIALFLLLIASGLAIYRLKVLVPIENSTSTVEVVQLVGTVKKIDDNSITIAEATGAEKEYGTDESTQYIKQNLDGTDKKASDRNSIGINDQLIILTDPQREKAIAVFIIELLGVEQ